MAINLPGSGAPLARNGGIIDPVWYRFLSDLNRLVSTPEGLATVLGMILTTRGDLLTRDATGVVRKALGAAGTLLRSDGTDTTWATMATALGSLLTTRGDLATRDASTVLRLAVGVANTILFSNGTDPAWATIPAALATLLTSRGDLIRKGSADVERLALGASGTVLRSDGTDAAWATIATALATLLTTRGDIITRDASNVVRLALGGANTILFSNATDPAWATIPAALATLLTSRGDLITKDGSTVIRLALGAANTFLGSDGTDPSWRTAAQTRTSLGLTNSSTDNAVARFDGTAGAIQNSGVTIDDNNTLRALGLGYGTQLDVTIATGAVTITRPGIIRVDTEAAAAADDLDTITFSGAVEGDIIVVQNFAGGRAVTARDGVGNLLMAGNFTMGSTQDALVLARFGSNWKELSRSDNA